MLSMLMTNTQVSRFILAHLELFGTILRDHMSSVSLRSLEVLALTTSLISHCGIGQNITNEVCIRSWFVCICVDRRICGILIPNFQLSDNVCGISTSMLNITIFTDALQQSEDNMSLRIQTTVKGEVLRVIVNLYGCRQDINHC